jgi:hypothetical protein
MLVVCDCARAPTSFVVAISYRNIEVSVRMRSVLAKVRLIYYIGMPKNNVRASHCMLHLIITKYHYGNTAKYLVN